MKNSDDNTSIMTNDRENVPIRPVIATETISFKFDDLMFTKSSQTS